MADATGIVKRDNRWGIGRRWGMMEASQPAVANFI